MDTRTIKHATIRGIIKLLKETTGADTLYTQPKDAKKTPPVDIIDLLSTFEQNATWENNKYHKEPTEHEEEAKYKIALNKEGFYQDLRKLESIRNSLFDIVQCEDEDPKRSNPYDAKLYPLAQAALLKLAEFWPLNTWENSDEKEETDIICSVSLERLNGAGIPTCSGRQFSQTTIRDMLNRGFKSDPESKIKYTRRELEYFSSRIPSTAFH